MAADNKATKEEIEAFLSEFKAKSKVFDIAFNRKKEENLQFLLDFEMPPDDRKKYIMNLKLKTTFKVRVLMITMRRRVMSGCLE